jgi:hypothetical protein
MSSFSATASANGTSLTSTKPSGLGTSSATATATSNVSQEDAQNLANSTAQQVANSVVQNDANIISQTLTLSPAYIKGAYSNYNTNYLVNYAEAPQFLTYIYTDISNNISLNVQLNRNIYDSANELKTIGTAEYSINFRYTVIPNGSNTIYLLSGTYTTLQIVYDSINNNQYYIYKSGFLEQYLNGPLTSNNYSIGLIKYAILKSDIVQSVEIQNLTTNNKTTFTNAGIKNTTPSFPPYPTTYSLNFDNAILTSIY